MTASPTCPGCGGEPMPFPFPLDGQAFCDTDGCHVVMWNPDVSLTEALDSVQWVTLEGS